MDPTCPLFVKELFDKISNTLEVCPIMEMEIKNDRISIIFLPQYLIAFHPNVHITLEVIGFEIQCRQISKQHYMQLIYIIKNSQYNYGKYINIKTLMPCFGPYTHFSVEGYNEMITVIARVFLALKLNKNWLQENKRQISPFSAYCKSLAYHNKKIFRILSAKSPKFMIFKEHMMQLLGEK
jgi:hypothetical protein